MAQHGEYWTCSKIADKIRGTKKPTALELHTWDEWHDEAKAAHPFRYWIAEEFLGDLQDFIFYIPGKYRDLRYWIRNRFIRRHYALTSKLNKNQWHDLDTRILHCCFDELVNFVHQEKGHMQKISYTADDEIKNLSDRDAGLMYLDWEISLTHDYLEKDDPLYYVPTLQAENAKWIKEAYLWWTEVRPNRPDPMEVSGWSEYCDSAERKDGKRVLSWLTQDKTPEEREFVKSILDNMHSLENQYSEEDTNMLIELVKRRGSLWT